MSCVTARVNKGKNHVISPLGLQTDKFVCPENILKTFHERNETKTRKLLDVELPFERIHLSR